MCCFTNPRTFKKAGKSFHFSYNSKTMKPSLDASLTDSHGKCLQPVNGTTKPRKFKSSKRMMDLLQLC